MNNKTIYLFIWPLILIMLLAGCTRSVKVDEQPPVEEEVDILIEVEMIPEEEVIPDYDSIGLEILNIQLVEEKAGSYNSYNPQVSFNEEYIAFEISHEMFNKIYIYRIIKPASTEVSGYTFERIQEVHLEESFGEELIEDFFESSIQESFNYEFTWFPKGSSFIFTSNAGMGEYNLFIGSAESDDTSFIRIQHRLKPKSFGSYFMMTEDVKKDGQARVSPDGTRIVFTSGRTGNGDLYLLDLTTGDLKRLTHSEYTDFFPRWSPDGKDIAFTTGGKQAHDIHVIRNVGKDNEREEVLIKWFFDDVLPQYSPDGEKISFYTTYNEERDPFNTKRWGIMIIPSDGSAPEAGNALIEYFHASDVIKDNIQGTAWFPDSTHMVFAKNIDSDYNPIYIYDIETREERFVKTDTNINHDITVSPHGFMSFRAQVLGWDRVFIASTTFYEEYRKGLN